MWAAGLLVGPVMDYSLQYGPAHQSSSAREFLCSDVAAGPTRQICALICSRLKS
jgi:hypothetical protein